MSEPQSWFMYVVACSDSSLYCGVTTNIERRISEHNMSPKGAKYTRSRRPVSLVYFAPFTSRSTAQIAEAAFKKLSRAEKLRRIQ